MHSLTQISHQLKITKPALMARIRKIPNFRDKYRIRKGNKLFINKQGLKLISQPKHDSTSKLMKTRKGDSSHHLNRAQLLTIIKQLRHKNTLLTKTNYSQQQVIARNNKDDITHHSRTKIQEHYDPKVDKATQTALIAKNHVSKMRIQHMKDVKIIAYYRNMSWIDKLKNLFNNLSFFADYDGTIRIRINWSDMYINILRIARKLIS